jgi:2-amino-4-hydroxy-6-hydroxymethyldihydropteridine diphosphokinase
MNEVYLCLGGNLGDREGNLSAAKKLLIQAGCKIIRESSIYETSPWGNETHLPYLNQVIVLETSYSPNELMQLLLEIEQKLGRVRGNTQWEDRLIDIDILSYNLEIIENKELTIPHPRLHLRKFVLVPLCEISPELIHPVLQKTIRQLLTICPDQGEIIRLNS